MTVREMVMSAAGASGGYYATWNPADKDASITLSGSNLTETHTSAFSSCRATIGKSSGKWYWETVAASNVAAIGVSMLSHGVGGYPGNDSTSYSWYGSLSQIYHNAGGTAYFTYTAGDTIGCALDMDAGTLGFYVNGVWQGLAVYAGVLTGTWYPTSGSAGAAGAQTTNFGAAPFVSLPSGYSGLHV